MSKRPNSRRKKFRLTVKLDYAWDADLIRWLESLPEGYRSQAVRQGLRQYLELRSQPDLRQMISDELAKALDGRQIGCTAAIEKGQAAANEAEARYGSKLDQMLGGLRKSSTDDK
jgi:hypothetical protein